MQCPKCYHEENHTESINRNVITFVCNHCGQGWKKGVKKAFKGFLGIRLESVLNEITVRAGKREVVLARIDNRTC